MVLGIISQFYCNNSAKEIHITLGQGLVPWAHWFCCLRHSPSVLLLKHILPPQSVHIHQKHNKREANDVQTWNFATKAPERTPQKGCEIAEFHVPYQIIHVKKDEQNDSHRQPFQRTRSSPKGAASASFGLGGTTESFNRWSYLKYLIWSNVHIMHTPQNCPWNAWNEHSVLV